MTALGLIRSRAPKVAHLRRVASTYPLSGLVNCSACKRALRRHDAKSGQFAYCIFGTLHYGSSAKCDARYLNAPEVESITLQSIRERILSEETITELVNLVAEEIDALAGEIDGRPKAIEAELGDVESRPENLYQALEIKHLPLEVLCPRILSLKSRQGQLIAARDEAEWSLECRRAELPTSKEIREHWRNFRDFCRKGPSLNARPSYGTPWRRSE